VRSRRCRWVAKIHGGWFLLIGNRCNHRLIDEDFLARLSSRWKCVACSVEEHVMVSSAALWEAGEPVWEVTHDAQDNIFHLASSGRLPEGFAATRDRVLREQEREGGQQAGVDLVFDVPLLLAKSLTGYKHDEPVEFLPTPPPGAFLDKRRPWWKFW
jgi:hypothetical protein